MRDVLTREAALTTIAIVVILAGMIYLVSFFKI